MLSQWQYIFQIGAWSAFVLGAGVLIWAWMPRRKANIRRRCPRCGFDMSHTEGLRCTECGRIARSEGVLLNQHSVYSRLNRRQ